MRKSTPLKSNVKVGIKVFSDMRSLCSNKCPFFHIPPHSNSAYCLLYSKFLRCQCTINETFFFRATPCLRDFGK